MKVTICLPEDPTPEQIMRASAVIAFVGGGYKSSASPAAITAAAPAAPPPPAPPPPVAEGEASVFQASVGAVTTAAETPRDATNLPWDERIHSSAKSQNKDGTWKKRKGVGDSFVTQIEAELRAVPGNAAPVAPAPAPPPPAAPAAPAAPAPVAPASDNPFVAMMKLAGPKLAAKTLTNEAMIDACKSVGLDSLPALAQRHDLVPTVSAILGLV